MSREKQWIGVIVSVLDKFRSFTLALGGTLGNPVTTHEARIDIIFSYHNRMRQGLNLLLRNH